MPERDGQRDRELLLAPNEFSFIRDQATGAVNVLVGTKKTLDPGDTPVIYDSKSRRFKPTDVETSKQIFTEADESSYIVLYNPSVGEKFPTKGTNSPTELMMGSKINILGPRAFPLWPSQVATVIAGHQLRSNQYLVCKVYNEAAANENIKSAVLKTTKGNKDGFKPDIKSTGQLFIIKGTDISFFMPWTGVEVIPEQQEDGTAVYVRDAVSLERLEYCILLSENGDKRYVKGPDVVFPEPNETFVSKNRQRKFRAIELNENMGIYIKVIAAYTDESGEHKVGDEMFLTGKDQKIYFPREEHQLVTYGDDYIYYAIAIPQGEGRYVLNKETSKIETKVGPLMFLPDPRKEVIVRRVLDQKTVDLWFPGNKEAQEINRKMAEELEAKKRKVETESLKRAKATDSTSSSYNGVTAAYSTARSTRSLVNALEMATQSLSDDGKDSVELGSDAFVRKTEFTPPRTLTLNTKYDGVINISPWTGYAVQIVPKVGQRKVLVGPASILLDYDWELEVLTLSTGVPKSDESPKKTVYLRIQNNTVSDRITALTKDDVQVTFDVKYVVNFEGDPNKWFNVENYVALLTDRMRSITCNMVKQHDVQDLKDNAANYLRDLILGKKNAEGKRENAIDFSKENGMIIRDVTVSPIKIGNTEIDAMIIKNQHEVIKSSFEKKNMERQLEIEREKQRIALEIETVKSETLKKLDEFKKAQLQRAQELKNTELEATLSYQERLDSIAAREQGRTKATEELKFSFKQKESDMKIAELQKEAEMFCSKFKAIQPDLVAAIQAFGERELATALAKNLPQAGGSLGFLLGQGGLSALKKMVEGTALAKALDSIEPASK